MGFFTDKKKQEEIKAKAEQARKEAEKQADSLLVSVGKSKWTWAIVLGIVATAWLLGFIVR